MRGTALRKQHEELIESGKVKPEELCTVCEIKDRCKQLCHPVRVWANQDYVPKRELTITDLGIERRGDSLRAVEKGGTADDVAQVRRTKSSSIVQWHEMLRDNLKVRLDEFIKEHFRGMKLTLKQKAVSTLLMLGFQNKEIAKILDITASTVRDHKKAVEDNMRKYRTFTLNEGKGSLSNDGSDLFFKL